MKIFIPAVLIFALTIFSQNIGAQDTESYTKVASRLVELINAADYSGVENLFNQEMSKALPLKKATDFFAGIKAQFGRIQKLDQPKRSGAWTVFPAHFERGLIDMSMVLDRQNKIAGLNFKPRPASSEVASKKQPDAESYTKVANRLVELINAADYSGIENLFNREMSQALPLEKATEFFRGLIGQAGKIQKLDEPKRNAGESIFPVRFERATLDLSLALDDENKIAGLTFKPRDPSSEVASKKQPDTQSYTKVANHLVELINAANYSGVENLFNQEMSQALPLEKTTEFFKGLTGQAGKIQKLDEPKRDAEGMIFPARCERATLDMSLSLDDESKIAALNFKPHAASSETAPKKHLTQLSLPFNGNWLVAWGGDTKELNQHHDVPAQQFAFDLVGADENGKSHRGEGTKNEDYACFGREILAPADGVVVEAIDGVRDNTPGSMNPYCLVGNCVVIQHRSNEFSVLAHLQRGSVTVKAGEQVKRGQLLGKCGNSGNSSEPHLHYHLQHSPIFQDALSIKTIFQKISLTKNGQPETKPNYSPVKGDMIGSE